MVNVRDGAGQSVLGAVHRHQVAILLWMCASCLYVYMCILYIHVIGTVLKRVGSEQKRVGFSNKIRVLGFVKPTLLQFYTVLNKERSRQADHETRDIVWWYVGNDKTRNASDKPPSTHLEDDVLAPPELASVDEGAVAARVDQADHQRWGVCVCVCV